MVCPVEKFTPSPAFGSFTRSEFSAQLSIRLDELRNDRDRLHLRHRVPTASDREQNHSCQPDRGHYRTSPRNLRALPDDGRRGSPGGFLGRSGGAGGASGRQAMTAGQSELHTCDFRGLGRCSTGGRAIEMIRTIRGISACLTLLQFGLHGTAGHCRTWRDPHPWIGD